jgi:hypothetical protein
LAGRFENSALDEPSLKLRHHPALDSLADALLTMSNIDRESIEAGGVWTRLLTSDNFAA